MGLTLAPIQAGISEPPSRQSCRLQIDPQGGESFPPSCSDFVSILPRLAGGQPFEDPETVVQHDSDRSRDMIVAGSCRAQTVRRIRYKPIPRTTCDYAQPFQGPGHAPPRETVIPMLPLNDHFDQLGRSQTIQVDAGGGRTDTSDDRQLCAGPGMAVQKAIEHARPRRLTNRGRDGRDCDISSIVSNHSFIVNEVCMSAKHHALSHGFRIIPDPSGTPSRSLVGHAGRRRCVDHRRGLPGR
jgi:hypothetical protein